MISANLSRWRPAAFCLLIAIGARAAETWVAQPASDRRLLLSLRGTVESNNPHHHRPQVEWVPISWVRLDGEAVHEGDVLVTFDTSVIDFWRADKRDTKRVEEASLETTNRQTEQDLTRLQLQREVLQAERRYLQESIEATRIKDNARRRILELQLAQAERRFETARDHQRKVTDQSAADLFSAAYLDDAETKLARAKSALALPRFELEVFDQATGAFNRELLNIDLQKSELSLGNELGVEGVFGEINALERLRSLRDSIKTTRIREMDWWLDRYAKMAADNAVRAEVDGVLALNRKATYAVEVGSKHSSTTLAFVLQPTDLIVELILPESYRHLVHLAESGRQQPVTLSVPGAGVSSLSGSLLAIGAAARPAPRQQLEGFRCVIRLTDRPPTLRAGMTVEAAIPISLPRGAVVVPRWFVQDPQHPQVLLEDGEQREVEGFELTQQFVITAGLEGGESVRLPKAVAGPRRLRIGGDIRPVDAKVLKWNISGIRRWRSRWIYGELVPDGTLVRAGEPIARAYPAEGRPGDRTYQLRHERTEKEAQLAIDRVEAENRLIRSYVSWRQQHFDADRDRLEYLYERFSSFERELLQAEAKRDAARLAGAEAEREAATAAEDTSGFVSRHRQETAKLTAAEAALTAQKADLATVAALRARDWLNVNQEEAAMAASRARAAAERRNYGRQRVAYELALQQARGQYQDYMRDYDRRMRDETNIVLFAPVDGRLFYYAMDVGDPLPAIGEPIQYEEAFIIPSGDLWEFRAEIPARLHQQFAVGDELAIVVPALGPLPHPGRVHQISPYFEVSQRAFEEQLLRDSLGTSEPVFHVRIRLELEAQERDRASPGLTAYLDI